MIVGYILIISLVGLIAFAVALLSGASFWFALGSYTLVGSAVLVLLPVTRMLVDNLTDQDKATTATDRWNPKDNLALVDSPIDQSAAAPITSMRILAVDDDPFILELIPMISAKAGFSEVTPAESGEEALKLLKNYNKDYDCLLLDINMPGMDGIELCRRVRQIPQYGQTPIIMLTAMRDIQNMADAYRSGASDYAIKPFDIEDLGTRLRLAQEAVRVQREASTGKKKGLRSRRSTSPNHSFEIPEPQHLRGNCTLVNQSALSSYLTQLPRKNVADVQMFAINLDDVEDIYTQFSSKQFIALLEEFATAAVGCFGTDQILMAYTDTATLLVAATSATSPPAISIEIDIERQFKFKLSEVGLGHLTGTSVSVGGPVQLQGTKAQRARMVTDRVTALAESRALNKQGRQIAGLFKR